MVEDFIQVQPDSTGKKLRALKQTIGGNDVESEVVILSTDGSNTIDPRQVDITKPALRTPLFAPITASAAGATTIVAADASNKVKAIGVLLMANGTVNVKWQSGTTDLTGLAYLVANNGYILPIATQFHWFEAAINNALNINLSAAVAVGGTLVYVKEAS